jgi:hypothetical protein
MSIPCGESPPARRGLPQRGLDRRGRLAQPSAGPRAALRPRRGAAARHALRLGIHPIVTLENTAT